MILQTGRCYADEKGVGLLDVLAATVISGMALTIIGQLVMTALSTMHVSEQKSLAFVVGRSIIAEYEAGAIKSTTGQYPDIGEHKLLWRFDSQHNSASTPVLRVSWRERSRNEELTLPVNDATNE